MDSSKLLFREPKTKSAKNSAFQILGSQHEVRIWSGTVLSTGVKKQSHLLTTGTDIAWHQWIDPEKQLLMTPLAILYNFLFKRPFLIGT